MSGLNGHLGDALRDGKPEGGGHIKFETFHEADSYDGEEEEQEEPSPLPFRADKGCSTAASAVHIGWGRACGGLWR